MTVPGVQSRIIAIAVLAAILAPTAVADEKPVRIAHYAVTKLIKERAGRDARVVFEKDNDGFLSFSERKVTGEGYVRTDSRTRDFMYSVKVKPSSEEYRDVEVILTGERWRDEERWYRTDWNREREWGREWDRDRDRYRYDERAWFVRFKQPYNYQRFDDDPVSFRGEASNGRVRLRVYDWDGRKVLDRDLGVVRGEWWTTARFDRGTFKAVAELNDSRKEDVRYFVVRDRFGGTDLLRIDPPGWGAFRNGIISLTGRSSDYAIRYRIYDDRDRKVAEREVRVRDGRWSFEERVYRSGEYRVRVENVRQRGNEERRFTVSGGSRL